MKILFVSRENFITGESPIIRNQRHSLIDKQNSVTHFTIKGKGLLGYLKSIPSLRKQLCNGKYDIVHSHYLFSAIIASISGAKPHVVSLMGSDVYQFWWSRLLIKFFNTYLWSACIVKSLEMKETLGINNLYIIPNGVNLENFIPIDRKFACMKLSWNTNVKNILFPSTPNRNEKNVKLLYESLKKVKSVKKIELHFLRDVPHTQTYLYYCASDLTIMTSKWEGSPNAVKEAMACNCPIVSTNVGDVGWVLGKTPGCFISSSHPDSLSKAIEISLARYHRTKGRERIIYLGLDSKSIANKVIYVYNEVLGIK